MKNPSMTLFVGLLLLSGLFILPENVLPSSTTNNSTVASNTTTVTVPATPVVTNTPSLAGANEQRIYNAYTTLYLQSDGSMISNPPSFLCANGGIGCGQEVTSEAMARSMEYDALRGNKANFDKKMGYVMTYMFDPVTNHLKWNLVDDVPKSGVGGQNSAPDAELLMINALYEAESKWGGTQYRDLRIKLSNAMKGGLISGKYLPMCMYPSGTSLRPCDQRVFLGYNDLKVMKRLCASDAGWCVPYEETKKIMVGAITTQGMYSVYYSSDNRYSYEQADIFPNWVLEHTFQDPSTRGSADTFYGTSRAVYYGQLKTSGNAICAATDMTCNYTPGKLCQEFSPTTGCKVASPPHRVYALYAELACDKGDAQFANDMLSTIKTKCFEDGNEVCNSDHYGNVVALQAMAYCGKKGYAFG